MQSRRRARPDTVDHLWLAVPEAAERLGVSTFVLRRWIKHGLLAAEWREQEAGPQQLHVLIRPNDRPLPPHDRQDTAPLLIGRERELETLTQLLEQAADGRGGLAIVGGDSGIGKTTLVNAAVSAALDSDFQILTGQCYDTDDAPIYGLWQDAVAVTTTRTLTGLHGAIERHIVETAMQAPALIVLEDLHWADRPSLDLLRHLARKLAHLPVAIVTTYRDVDLGPDQPFYLLLPHLVRESRATRINLRPLSEDDVTAILRQRYDLPEDDAQRLREYIWKYAQGNPFFSEELATHLEHERVLRDDGGSWSLGDLPDFRVPPLIQQVLAHRLERVCVHSLAMLRTAAVIGHDVPLDLWQEVSGATAQEMATCIDEALAAQLIVEDLQRDGISFRHALIRETLYNGLQIIRRRAQHQRVAEVLATGHEGNAGLVAHHFLQAHDPRAVEWLLVAGKLAAEAFAFQTAIDTFERAMAVLAHHPERREGRAWLACELAAAYRYTDSPTAMHWTTTAAELAATIDDPALHTAIHWVRSHVRGFLGENGLTDLREAMQAYDQLAPKDVDRINATSLSQLVRRGHLAQRIADYARYDEARTIGEDFLRTAAQPRTLGEHYDLGVTHLGLGLAYANLGLPDEARAAFATARDHLGQAGNQFLIGSSYLYEYRCVIEPYVPDRVEARRHAIEQADTHFQRSVVAMTSGNQQHGRIFGALVLEGRWAEVRASAERLSAMRYVQIGASEALAELDLLQGFTDLAWQRVDAAIPEGSSLQPPATRYHELAGLQRIAAELALAEGQLDLAHGWIRSLQRWLAWSDTVLNRYLPDLLLAKLHLQQGDHHQALEQAVRAVQGAREPRQPLGLLRAERLIGEICTETGDLDNAARHLGLALDLSRSIQAPYETALSETAYARYLLARHHLADAGSHLSAARATFEHLEATPALARLSAFEAKMGRLSDRPGAGFGLSPREIEVLRLVAQGMTDASIGEQLYISRRTVNGHVQSIFNKCGVTSRAAATAFAFTHGIVSPGG